MRQNRTKFEYEMNKGVQPKADWLYTLMFAIINSYLILKSIIVAKVELIIDSVNVKIHV